jgi:NADPH:quinone reductase-like Zn-dependent oxidoreductase
MGSVHATSPYALPAGFEPPVLQLPPHQTVIEQDASGTATIVHNASLPVPEPHEILVKVVAVSLNPCDWKMPARFPTAGARIGCDFSGTVAAIGPDVRNRTRFRLGDRVCGGVHGSNPINLPSGAFAQYVAADTDLTLKLPDDMSWEAGAVLGASVMSTLSIVLYSSLELKATPDEPLRPEMKQGPYVLVYGASTSTGTMALQLLKL